LNYGIQLSNTRGDASFYDSLTKYFIAAIIFYSTALFIYPRYLPGKKWSAFALAMIVLLMLSYLVRELVLLYLYPLWMQGFNNPYTHIESLIMHFWWYTQYCMLGIAYWIGKETVNREWEITKLKLGIVEAEFNALKAQIDPHFLYNTLNYIYAAALDVSETLADRIIDLSDVMRYSIEKKEDEFGRVLLVDEMRNIERLLALYMLRFNNTGIIKFKKSGILEELRVPPYLLMIPIENIFKHGDVTQEIIISVVYEEEDSLLIINTSNYKNLKSVSTTGIGLDNLERRLEYHYGENYKLLIKQNFEIFELTIEIYC
jgi:LytS/YehU family sensor histidine kinase